MLNSSGGGDGGGGSGGGGTQKSPVAPPQSAVATPPPLIPNMQVAYSTGGNAVYKPVSGNGNGEGMSMNSGMGMGMVEAAKKKRGRPRKYVPEASIASVPLSSAPAPANISQTPPSGTFSSPPPLQQQQTPPPPQQQQQTPPPPQQQMSQPQDAGAAPSTTTTTKKRGRPPGSGKRKRLEDLGFPGIGFTPHVITVNTGEDLTSKIVSFSQSGPRAICILSANGAISNVTLRHAATSGGSVTYEGRYEIVSLSGSFMLSESGGPRNRTGALSVSLAGPDGSVIGGAVAGFLVAASPVQVVVGSFVAESRREPKMGNTSEPLIASAKPHAATGAAGPSSPHSRGTLSESSDGPGSPLNHSTGAVNSTPPGMANIPWK